MIENIKDIHIQSIALEDEIVEEKVIIGSFKKNSGKIKVINIDGMYNNLKGKEIKIVNYGTWYVNDIKDIQNKVTAELQLFDLGNRFDTAYDDSFVFPASLKSWATWIGNKVGVPLATDFTNSDYVFHEKPYFGNKPSYRDAVRLIAKYAGSFVQIINDKYYIKWFENTVKEIEDWKDLDSGNETDAINVVVLGKGDVEDNIKYPEIELDKPCELRIDSEFLGVDRRQLIIPIYNHVNGFKYRKLNMKLPFGTLDLRAGMKVSYIDLNNKRNETFITSHILQYVGGDYTDSNAWRSTIAMSEIDETNTNYKYASSIEERILNAERNTDKINGIITDTVSQVTEHSEELTKVEQTLSEISQTVTNVFDFVRTEQGTYQIHITDAMSYDIRKLTIRGTHVPFFVYTNDNLYANNDLYLDDNDGNSKTTYTIVVDTSPRSNPSNNKKEYVFTLNEPLRKYGSYTDELIINEDHKVQLIRRIHCIDNEYRLYDEPIIQYLENTQIILFENENYIYIKETEILQLDITYLNNNPLNDQFVNQIEFKNVMTQTRDTFNVQLEKKVDNNSIIAEINATTQTDHGGSEIFLGADKIRFNGKIFDLTVDDISIISKNLRIMPDGTIEAINGKFSGTIDGSTINGGLIKGATVVLEDTGGTQDASFSIHNSKNDDDLILTSNCIQMVGNHRAFYIILDEIVGDNDAIMSLPGFSIKGNSDCYIAGNIQCEKDIYCNTLIQTSVESKKKNIVQFSNALDVILQGDIYSYRYKNEKSTIKKHIGLVVGSNYKAPKEVISENGIDTYSMSAVEWQAIKELIKITELQKSKIEELERRISKIEGEKK